MTMRILKRLAVAASIGLALAASIVAQRPVPDNFDRSIRQHGEDLWERGRESSASTRSATRPSGAARSSCTRRSQASASAASVRASARRPRSRVGLKVDAEALPADAAAGAPARPRRPRRSGRDAGAARCQRGRRRHRLFASPDGALASVGIQCALCHSTVDDSVAPGIGRRLDGWPNRDLNVGAIVALAPDLSAVADLLQHRRGDGAHGAEQLGPRASSTRSCSSTARRSGPTARPRRR